MLGSFSLTYLMSGDRCVHESDTAQEALEDHASLLAAGADEIAIRDPKGLLVTIDTVNARAKGPSLAKRRSGLWLVAAT
jgi:hypothetical protein